MVYVIVFFGSFAGICLVLFVHILLQQRGVRRFVRSIRQRFQHLHGRHVLCTHSETDVYKPKNGHPSMRELQEVYVLLRTAERMQVQGKDVEVERLLIQALTVQPQALEVRTRLAQFYLQTNRASKAEALYRELVQQSEDASLHASLGLACERQEKFAEACVAYQEAWERDPKNRDRIAALGRACVAARQYQEAIPFLEKASVVFPRDSEVLSVLADCYLEVGDATKAELTLQRLHRVEPYNEEVKEKLLSLARA